MEVPAHFDPNSLAPNDCEAHRQRATPNSMAEKCDHCKLDKCVHLALYWLATKPRGH